MTALETERDGIEASRLTKRQWIKRGLAEAQINEQKRQALEAEIQKIERGLDDLACTHQAAMQPLQEELERLERSAISLITDRRAPDKKADDRRRQIVSDITLATRELESAVAVEKRVLGKLRTQMHDFLQTWTTPQKFENDLVREASTDHLNQHFVSQQTVQIAAARSKLALAKLEEYRHAEQSLQLAQARGVPVTTDLASARRLIQRWQAEANFSARALAEACAESAALHRKMIDE